ncbi:prepilin peptidase [Lapillicoccus sp.]|uniref:prepilin peptidase n=1 Tax=Lapillicoccus sp. TaxID=1909287 RepID=UPI00326770A4
MTSWAAAEPASWWVCAAVVLVAVVLGHRLGRALATGGYRLGDEEHRRRPAPAWLVAVALPVLWGVLAVRLGAASRGALLPAYLLLAWVGLALAWVDADVHRLPEGLSLPAVPGVAALLTVATVTTGDWGALLRAAVCGVAGWLVYLALALAVPGGLGLGDATVGGLVALALGYLGWGVPMLGFLLAYLLAGLVVLVGLTFRRLHLKSAIAFGPFILLGGLLAPLLHVQL